MSDDKQVQQATTNRVVVLAVSRRDGEEWVRKFVDAPVVIVTPRSQWACRGYVAHRIEVTAAAAEHPRLDEMRCAALPCLVGAS